MTDLLTVTLTRGEVDVTIEAIEQYQQDVTTRLSEAGPLVVAGPSAFVERQRRRVEELRNKQRTAAHVLRALRHLKEKT